MHLVDRTDLFKINNFSFGWKKKIVMNLYSSLKGQRQKEIKTSRTRVWVYTSCDMGNSVT